MEREVRTYHRHATGMADVHGDGVSGLFASGAFPFDEELHARNGALMTSQSFPTFLQCECCGVVYDAYGHDGLTTERVLGLLGGDSKVVPGNAQVNSTFYMEPNCTTLRTTRGQSSAPKAKGRSEGQTGLSNLIPAATYVPTQLPAQYHRPSEA